MAYTSRCETVKLRHTPEHFDERPIDGEFVLPEYCPDITAILKCFVIPTVNDKQHTGANVTVDGHVQLRVLYVSDNREQVYCCEFTVPFSASVAVGEQCDICGLHTRVEYVNCRAAGPRRIEVHGAFRLYVSYRETDEMSVLTEVCGDGIFADTCTLQYSAPIGCAEKTFTVNEILDAAPASEPIHRLVYTRATPLLTDYKQLAGKSILKGELLVFALYCCDEESGILRQFEQSIPFSQIIDADCIAEDSIDEVYLEVDNCDMRSAVDPNGENTLLSVNCKLTVHCICSKDTAVQAVSDAFCRSHPISLEKQTVTLRRTSLVRRENYTVRQSIALPTDDITDILSVWCDLLQVNGGQDRQLTGRLQLNLLCRNGEKTVSFYERPLDFTTDLTENSCGMTVFAAIRHTEYAVVDKSLELRLELCCRCHYCEETTCTVVSNASVNEEVTVPQEPCGVKLYFAEAGESLWDIAKYCRTSREAIVNENEPIEEVLTESRMLLIPVV